jgi:hypothetical protein
MSKPQIDKAYRIRPSAPILIFSSVSMIALYIAMFGRPDRWWEYAVAPLSPCLVAFWRAWRRGSIRKRLYVVRKILTGKGFYVFLINESKQLSESKTYLEAIGAFVDWPGYVQEEVISKHVDDQAAENRVHQQIQDLTN